MFSSPASRRLTLARQRRRRDLSNLALWTVHGWLAMFFIAAGYAKVAEPMAYLEILLGWASADQERLVRTLGWFEIALGLASLAPALFGRVARTPFLIGAAVMIALASIMIVVHSVRLEAGAVTVNLALLGLAVSLWVGRRDWLPERYRQGHPFER